MKHLAIPKPVRLQRRRAVIAGIAAAATAVILLVPGLVELSLAIAAGIILAALLLGLLALAVSRRLTARLVREHPHLLRLGHRFERRFDNARVTAVLERPNGQLTLQLAWQGEHTVELDINGVPDTSSSSGPGTLSWFIPAQPPSSFERDMLKALPTREVTLVEEGTILPQGPVVTSRELIADNGIVLHAIAPAFT